MLRLLLLVLCAAVPAFAVWQGGLRVKFGVNPIDIGRNSFIELPQSQTSAFSNGWILTQRPEGPREYASLQLWCPYPDLVVCVLTDDTGYIAGMQIALEKAKITESVYDFKTQGFTNWTIAVNGQNKSYWATQMYFVTPQFLRIPAATRIANRKDNVMLQDRAVMVSGFNGTLYSISTRVNEVSSGASDFTQQACVRGMGRHWFYMMTKNKECKSDTLLPWFVMTYDNQLTGIGFMIAGKYALPSAGERDWLERPDTSFAKLSIPGAPQCLYDLTENVGAITLHTYFIQQPYLLTCIGN